MNKNAHNSADHEVHVVGCEHGPNEENQISLGTHATCHGAMLVATKINENADGCFYCCNACHTS